MRCCLGADNDGVNFWIRRHIFDVRNQVYTGKSPSDLEQPFGAPVADRHQERLQQFVKNSHVVHSPIAATDYRDPQWIANRGNGAHSKRLNGGANSAPLPQSTAGMVSKKI